MKIRFAEKLKSRSTLAATFALAIGPVTPVMAGPVTFAQYFQSNGTVQQWVTGSGGSSTITATGDVLFLFSGVAGAPSGAQDATFTLTATSSTIGNCGVACATGDSFAQEGYTGTFSFTDETAGFVGDNLLSGTFTVNGSPSTSGGTLSSSIGASGASFDVHTNPGNPGQLVFTSQFINFGSVIQEDASWSLSSLIPDFAVGTVTGGQAFPSGTYDAAGAGTFSDATNTPEPATLGLIGAGLLGVATLRRKRVART
jgi:hypothetical protein